MNLQKHLINHTNSTHRTPWKYPAQREWYQNYSSA